jgi:TIR domain
MLARDNSTGPFVVRDNSPHLTLNVDRDYPKAQNVVRIFLSYGHDEYVSLASRVKRDLETRGHEVWFDVERLKPGGDWERYIEQGFERVSKDSECGRFLLLMTPHSVRRPDGYCLNELARAFGRSLPIIPVMVSTVEVPLSICACNDSICEDVFPSNYTRSVTRSSSNSW